MIARTSRMSFGSKPVPIPASTAPRSISRLRRSVVTSSAARWRTPLATSDTSPRPSPIAMPWRPSSTFGAIVPTAPKSMSQSPPSASTNTFPGCGSAWYWPSWRICRRNDRSSRRARARRARRRTRRRRPPPRRSNPRPLPSRAPCSPTARDRRAARVRRSHRGSRRSGGRRTPRAGSRARTRCRRSARPRPLTCPTRRAASIRRSAWRATSRITAASRSTNSATPGRCTFTTTGSPVVSTARWVWPMDAAARGSHSKLAKAVSTGSPSADSMASRTSSASIGRTLAWSPASSSVSAAGSRSVRVDAICPNFTIIPPASSMVSRSRMAKSGESIASAERYRTWSRLCRRAYLASSRMRPIGASA